MTKKPLIYVKEKSNRFNCFLYNFVYIAILYTRKDLVEKREQVFPTLQKETLQS